MIAFDEGLRVLAVVFRHTRDNAIQGARIEEITGISTRTIAEIISIAVAHGVPVASSSAGYFRWQNRDERDAYFRREKDRLISIGRKISQAKKNSINELSLFEQPCT